MLRVGLLSLVVFASCTVVVLAAGHDDLARGEAAQQSGDYDLAISSLTAALSDGDLDASLVPEAYSGRASAYISKGKCDLAQEDAAAALKLNPDFPDAMLIEGDVHQCAGDYTGAVFAFVRLAASHPSEKVYLSLGYLHWEHSDFTWAAADFAHAAELADKPTYDVLWHKLALLRAGNFTSDEEASAAKSIDLSGWPGPIFKLYAGKATPEEVKRAAEAKDARTSTNQNCEADFYIAEYWLAHRDSEKPGPLLEAARKECPHNFVEYGEARVELIRVGPYLEPESGGDPSRGLPNFP